MTDPTNVPSGYSDDITLGRPTEKASNINTQNNAFGRDRLGKKDMKVDDQPGFNSKSINETTYLKNRQFLEQMEKNMSLFKPHPSESSLLNENQLRD